MSVYDELMKEGKQWEPDSRQTKAMRDYIRDVKAELERAKAAKKKKPYKGTITNPKGSSGAHSTRGNPENAGTEYEGPSLAEIGGGFEAAKSGRQARLKNLKKTFEPLGAANLMKLTRRLIAKKKAGENGKPPPEGAPTAAKDHTEYEGPSLREKLEKVRRGVRAGATGSVTGGYLSVPGKKGTGRKVVGSWAQEKHRKPGSKVDPPITYAAKDHTEYEGPSLREKKKKKSKAPYGQGPEAYIKWLKSRESPIAKKRSDDDNDDRPAIRRRDPKTGIISHTEYEGPSLKEQLEYLIDRTGKTSKSALSREKKSKIMAKWLSKRGASKAERDPHSTTGFTQQQKTTTKAGEPVKATHTAKSGEKGTGGTSPFVSRTRIQIRPGEGHDAGVDIIRKPHAKKIKNKSQKEQLEYLASFFLNEQPRGDPRIAAMRARGVNTSVTSQVRSAETQAQGRGAMTPTQRRDMRIKFSGAQAKRTQRSWDRPGVTAAKPSGRVPSTTQGHFGNPSK